MTPSAFRKIAPCLWNSGGDPSVYGFIELDFTGVEDKSLIMPYVLASLNTMMLKNPELTSMVRWGRISQRREKMISVMVHIEKKQKDLSFINIDVKNGLTINEISERVQQAAKQVREEKDPHLGPVLKLIRFLPAFVIKPLLRIYSFLINEVGLRLGLRVLPDTPFGSVIVSNIGSLGLQKALLPLVPISRASMLMSIGKLTAEARVFEGSIAVRQIVTIGVTFDHRLFDGSHAAKMLRDFETAYGALAYGRG